MHNGEQPVVVRTVPVTEIEGGLNFVKTLATINHSEETIRQMYKRIKAMDIYEPLAKLLGFESVAVMTEQGYNFSVVWLPHTPIELASVQVFRVPGKGRIVMPDAPTFTPGPLRMS